jgi:hypothetical protein
MLIVMALARGVVRRMLESRAVQPAAVSNGMPTQIH